MSKYIMQEMPDLRGDGKRVKYPRLIGQKPVTLQQLAREIAAGTTFDEGEVIGMLGILVDKMAYYLGWGRSVKLDRLGAFSASLGLKRGVEREEAGGTKRNAASIRVRGVNFRAARELINLVNKRCSLERAKAPSYARPSEGQAERLALALAYLEEAGAMTTYQYALLTNLSRTSAKLELRALAEQGLLSTRGRGSHAVYILPKREEQSPAAEG